MTGFDRVTFRRLEDLYGPTTFKNGTVTFKNSLKHLGITTTFKNDLDTATTKNDLDTATIKNDLDTATIIGLCGAAGAGKDTVAAYLKAEHGYATIAFAEPLKMIVSILTGWPITFVEGSDPEQRPLRETLVHPVYGMTCRRMLQFVGTDLFRRQFHKDVWIEAVRGRIRDLAKRNAGPIVVSDVRFADEALALQEMGATIWRVTRPLPLAAALCDESRAHASEEPFEVANVLEVANDGTLAELHGRIDRLVAP